MKNLQQVARMADIRKQKLNLIKSLEAAKKLDPATKRKLISKKGMRW